MSANIKRLLKSNALIIYEKIKIFMKFETMHCFKTLNKLKINKSIVMYSM